MTPTNVLLDQLALLLATDPTQLAPLVLPVHVHLAKAAFTPSPILTVASFTEADFGGYVVLNAGLGAQQFFLESSSGTRIVQLLEPAGGWHWEATGVLNLPQTIHGAFVTDNANAILFGSFLLAVPVALLAINDGVDLPNVRFRLPPSLIS
jgi:hypothetical protein